jgi:hypothetical protein
MGADIEEQMEDIRRRAVELLCENVDRIKSDSSKLLAKATGVSQANPVMCQPDRGNVDEVNHECRPRNEDRW